ncbi:DUF982 domain-containing protein [Mesorhizobium sp. Root102]|jgi:hypothetical protein|uniref:DUF982 domain-containing protein n=1 Tax=Mesorhizobium sp. Root102 TaxID=1736422 RepID=UPI0009EA8FCF|nr:DUF982 domain-containing protein [Mesorhizobium sp. Root102]
MKDRIFDRPIFVKNGKVREEISSMIDALNFLGEWPKGRRGPIYDTVVRACDCASNGQIRVSIAHDAFVSFAKSVKILENVATPPPLGKDTKAGPGGVLRKTVKNERAKLRSEGSPESLRRT